MQNQAQKNIVDYISRRLSEFFVVTNDPYDGATNYYKAHEMLKPFSETR